MYEFKMKATHLSATLLLATMLAAPALAVPAEFMFRARLEGEMVEGKPLAWNSEQMLLLGRDGRLHDFNQKLEREGEKPSPTFVPYPAAEMRAMLQHEFDNRFEVPATRHYLIVHPRGQRDEWADRFEELY